MSTSNQERLSRHILALSRSTNFVYACCFEWRFAYAEYVDGDDLEECPCGQPIREVCYIRNIVNGARTHVGNVCIRRFFDHDTGALFQGIRRIAQDRYAAANDSLMSYAITAGLITDWEAAFLADTARQRKLSER